MSRGEIWKRGVRCTGAKDEDGCPDPLWRWFPYWHVSPCLPDW
ncbi:hypothetical protein HMPREF3196_01803 [Bifidobacterium bifidum]|uniref:Uncharacterized protein n=1 Tax=Bifidobacterium bifidum TaxID=1681 RepID=A0A133KL82_BIFBI|nr:hypothetical protein HMPREF3196_01803 [Bifidobacterium bifidum]